MLGNVEDGVENLKNAQTDVATLRRQAVFDEGELLGSDSMPAVSPQSNQIAISVNTP